MRVLHVFPCRFVFALLALNLAMGCAGRESAKPVEEEKIDYVERPPAGYAYHWTRKACYEEQKASGQYRYPGWDYIPTSKSKEQLLYYINDRLRHEAEPFVVLVIDETRVRAPMRFAPDPEGRTDLASPQILGALNLDAVVQVVDLGRNAQDAYELPPTMR